MRTGSWLDPAEKIGLASLTVLSCGRGGRRLSAERVDEELETVAGDVSISDWKAIRFGVADCSARTERGAPDFPRELIRTPPLSRRGLNWPSCRSSKEFAAGKITPVRSSDASSSSSCTERITRRRVKAASSLSPASPESIWSPFTGRPFIRTA